MKYLQILILLICHFSFPAFAQNCGYIFNPDEKIERFTEGYVHDFNQQISSRAVVKIPVVVHIVWKNAEENISDAQIQSQIDVLNQDFRKKNIDAKDVPGSFKTVAADCEIEFCLAQKDTLGQATSGITRRQTSTTFSNDFKRIYYQNLGGVNNWKPDSYLNIWVCNMGSVYGFTTSLKDALINPAEDGIIVDYRAFGTIGTALSNTSHNKGRTATHEIGHYFNLLHIWGTDDTCNDDDLVSDTPLQASANNGCPPFPQLSCGVGSMYMNFMDYTDDNCMGLFTVGQKARMLAALTEFRSGLLRGSLCTPTATQDIGFQWFIYPNPAKDFIYINLNLASSFKNKSISLIDNLGRVLIEKILSNDYGSGGWQQGLIQIPIHNLSNGVYFVSLKLDNQVLMKKMVVVN